MTELRNAIIKSTSLGYEDHGIFTAYLHLDYGGSGQGFGGYGLDAPPPRENRGIGRQPHLVAGFFIQRVLDVVGVQSWEKLAGKHIRVQADCGKVHAIGNILEDKWFCPTEEFKALAA